MEDIQPQDENIEMKKTFQSLKDILSKEETAKDYLFIYQLKILFIPKEGSFELAFDKGSDIAELITKLVDLLHLVFEMQTNKRQSLYTSDIGVILKDIKFKEKIIELEKHQSFYIDFTNPKLSKLFKIISNALDLKKSYTFEEYIDSILVNLSFVPGLEKLLKYQLYLLLHTYYLNPINVSLDYHENEINISDDVALDLITEIFSRKQNDVESVIKSLIFLNYGSLENSIKNCNNDKFISAIEALCLKFKNTQNIAKLSLCVEKITTMFVDELKRPQDKKKKNKRKKKSKKLDYNENTKKEVKENRGGESSKNGTNIINLNVGIIDVKSDKDANKIFESESVDKQNNKKGDIDDKDNLNQSEELNKYLNNIINYNSNMGNEAINEDMKKLQNLMLNIAEENMKMKGKIEEMDQNILKLNEQNLKQSQELVKQSQELTKQLQEIKGLKESVAFLTDECQDMKEILGNIQFRDLSKNFLRYFYPFLTDDDWKKIRKNKEKKGEIIAGIIEKFYPKANKQEMSIVKELIINSANLSQERNYQAHFITLEKYEDEINAYKKKKNLQNLTSPVAFCFLVNIGISDDVFDKAYSFLTKFFDRDLIAKKGNYSLDKYFK